MIVYSSTKENFLDDVMSNNIKSIIIDKFKESTGHFTGVSEQSSWENSLGYMERVLHDDDIPGNSGVSIEYHIPRTTKRIDFIITGENEKHEEIVIIIELKQWQKAHLTTKDAIVRTKFKHGEKETPHPSYQAWSYKKLLEDYNQTIEDDKIQLFPCAYLHNYKRDNSITNEFYKKHILNAPLFLKEDALKLRNFVKQHVKYGDRNKIIYKIENGKIRPSKNLADELSSMLDGNEEFVLIDDQKVVFENALQLANEINDGDKKILIVQGGPGTGKTVVAINLLVELTKRQKVVQYITRNSAPRLVYEAKLTGTLKRSHISNLFGSTGSFYSSDRDTYDVLIVDEAHRLNEKSGLFNNLGENQIKEIIEASKFSIFFIDEDQKVTLKDIGDREEIRKFARKLGVGVVELALESQFRCNGSDGYIAWLDDVLQIHKTANLTFDKNDYDFKIFDNPTDLHKTILEKNKINNKARVVAGYCWDWISKKNPELKDIQIGDYQATWNLDTDGQAWIIQPNSVSEVGCIHTCQGLEVDYIGVIVGPDLIVRNGKVLTVPEKRAKTDKSISGWKKRYSENPKEVEEILDRLIKNTYRTLMTRGSKGCYVYFTDKETEEYFRKKINKS